MCFRTVLGKDADPWAVSVHPMVDSVGRQGLNGHQTELTHLQIVSQSAPKDSYAVGFGVEVSLSPYRHLTSDADGF